MTTNINSQNRVRRHERDVALFGRLFADWSRGRDRRNAEAHQQLDAIEAQLARLERSVRMAEPSRRPTAAQGQHPGAFRSAIPVAVQQS